MSRNNSMMQLDPTIPVVTPDGKGEAIGWIDYSKDDDLLWVVFLQSNGECWIYPNHQIRAVPNITTGRMSGVSCKNLSHSIHGGAAVPSPAKNSFKTNGHSMPTPLPPFTPAIKRRRTKKTSRPHKTVFHIN